ncbi:MAG: tRNA (adenosine(37)-N6)-threonylcarbamoyltransferase complex dimerization subunit type 1 TsaB [Desulfobulbus propionicus]|nr:MAG: tRNA (adenosine(37)-N6)-threonylcarbamoyltransferase complex dimerization subunit type 1 TsaB [Desulfobulbus propionicus]
MADFLILAVETSSGCGSVALTNGQMHDGHLLAEVTLRPQVTHSRKLLGSVRFIMDAVGVTWSDLDGIAVCLGPGSFTGLRIGMAAAKGIAMGAGLPVLGVLSLDALAAQLPCTGQQLCCLLDARKKQVYSALYRAAPDNSQPQRCGKIKVQAPEELAASITEPTIMAGPGVAAYEPCFQDREMLTLISPVLVEPRASLIGYLGASQLQAGRFPAPGELHPVYIRASEAEINENARR